MRTMANIDLYGASLAIRFLLFFLSRCFHRIIHQSWLLPAFFSHLYYPHVPGTGLRVRRFDAIIFLVLLAGNLFCALWHPSSSDKKNVYIERFRGLYAINLLFMPFEYYFARWAGLYTRDYLGLRMSLEIISLADAVAYVALVEKASLNAFDWTAFSSLFCLVVFDTAQIIWPRGLYMVHNALWVVMIVCSWISVSPSSVVSFPTICFALASAISVISMVLWTVKLLSNNRTRVGYSRKALIVNYIYPERPEKIEEDASDYKTHIRIKIIPPETWSCAPGQYVRLAIPDISSSSVVTWPVFPIAWHSHKTEDYESEKEDEKKNDANHKVEEKKAGESRHENRNNGDRRNGDGEEEDRKREDTKTENGNENGDYGNNYEDNGDNKNGGGEERKIEKTETLYILADIRIPLIQNLGRIAAEKPITAIMDGPYGGTIQLQNFGTIKCFATNMGISQHILYLKSIAEGESNRNNFCRVLDLYWKLDDTAPYNLFSDELNTISNKSVRAGDISIREDRPSFKITIFTQLATFIEADTTGIERGDTAGIEIKDDEFNLVNQVNSTRDTRGTLAVLACSETCTTQGGAVKLRKSLDLQYGDRFWELGAPGCCA